MTKRTVKRQLETYEVKFADGKVERWEIRETRTRRYYIYREGGVCYGWSFAPRQAGQKFRKSVAEVGGIAVRRIAMVHIALVVPPPYSNR
jgi:hypothetical protein